MKIEWLVVHRTAVASSDRAERAILGVIFAGHFLCRNPLLSPKSFTQGRLMNIERLVADVTTVGSPERAERAILGVILAVRCFGLFRPYLW